MTTTGSPVLKKKRDRFDGLSLSELNDVERQSLMTLALTLLAEQHRPGDTLGSPEETRKYLRIRLAERKNEVFGCLFLDNRHRIIEVTELFQGTIDGASVHPRIVVQKALEFNAAAMLFFHYVPRNIMEIMCPDSLCGVFRRCFDRARTRTVVGNITLQSLRQRWSVSKRR